MRMLAPALFFFSTLSYAGRPVVSSLTLTELTQQSAVIFEGSPTRETPSVTCKHKQYAWKIVKVYKGDQKLRGTVVPVADHNYRMHLLQHPPSYRSLKFKDNLDVSSKPSILFTNVNEDGCFELAAQGAQVNTADRKQVQSLTAGP